MLQPFNDTSNSLGAQSDGWQGSNLFGTHSLPEIQPENRTVPLLVGPAQAPLQVFIDLVQEDPESDFPLAPMDFVSCLGFNVAGRNMRVVTTRRLTVPMLEVVVSDIRRCFLQIPQDGFG